MALVAVAAAGAIFFFSAVPPPRERIGIPPEWRELASRTVAGAYHVHSNRSDGSGDKSAIAAAAARSGLKFVILTDHGDGTRGPDPPVYLDGVLCIDAVEISTTDGHYVALDMARSPYPLGGFADAVVEDVARLGGFGIVAHPDSPKAALRWTPDRLPVDGMEWLNADSEWRDETRATLVRAALGYLVRPGEALARLLDRPASLTRWDRWSRSRPVVALAGADAHGGLGRWTEDPDRGLGHVHLAIPSYAAAFATFSNRVVLDAALTGNAVSDGRQVVDAIRAGHVYTVIDAIASPGLLDLRRIGTTVAARVLGPSDAQLVMLHSGNEVARTGGPEMRWESGGERGPYRVEVHVPRAPGEPPVPWLVSNEIFTSVAEPKREPGFEVRWTGALAQPLAWTIEKEASSSARLNDTAGGAVVQYRLGADRASSPYVAIAADLPSAATAIEAALTADRPMRLWIQVRGEGGARWGESVYIDPSDRLFRVPFSAMRPLGAVNGPLSSSSAKSVLFVVDLTNATPGSAGEFSVRSLSFR